MANAYGMLMASYFNQEDYSEALRYGRRVELIVNSASIPFEQKATHFGMFGAVYGKLNQLDSALYYGHKSFEFSRTWSGNYLHLGDVYAKKGNLKEALRYYRMGLPIAKDSYLFIDLVDINNEMSKIFEDVGMYDSAFYYAHASIKQANVIIYPEGQMRSATNIAHLYDVKGVRDSTIKYLKLAIALKERLSSRERTRETQSIAFNTQMQQLEAQQKLEQSELQYRSRLNVIILLAVLLIVLLAALGLWRRNVF